MESRLSFAWPRNVLILFSLLVFLQIIKGEPYDATADYYSLGEMVNEMSISAHQIKKLQETAPGRPENRVRPNDRNVHLEDLITMVSIHSFTFSLQTKPFPGYTDLVRSSEHTTLHSSHHTFMWVIAILLSH